MMTPLAAISMPTLSPVDHHGAAATLQPFSSVLQSTISASDDAGRAEDAQVAAQQLLSSALILPILSSLRDSPFLEDGPFAPGIAEERFMPMLDQEFADRIAKSSSFTLDELIMDRLVESSTPQRAGDAS